MRALPGLPCAPGCFDASASADEGRLSWYALHAAHLLPRLEEELEELIDFVGRAHQQFPVKHRSVRQALFRSLPYRVFFVVKSGRIEVLSVIHQSRDPARWP